MIHLVEQTIGTYKTSSDLGFHVHTLAQKVVEGSEVMRDDRKRIQLLWNLDTVVPKEPTQIAPFGPTANAYHLPVATAKPETNNS
jgi:hypothetical protein